MARLPAATDRDSVSDKARPFYDQMVETRWTVRGPIAHMLPYAPEAAAGAVFLGNTLRRNSTLTPAQTELAICVAARARNQPYVWAAHSPTLRRWQSSPRPTRPSFWRSVVHHTIPFARRAAISASE